MKRVSLFIVAAVLTVSFAQAQTALTYYDGNVIEGTRLSHANVKALMSDNSEALKAYKTGYAFNTTGVVIGIIGGGLVGWEIGTRLDGNKGNNTLLIAGLSSIGVGVGLALIGEVNVKKSIKLYNSRLRGNSLSYQIDFGLMQSGGVGFNMRF